MTMEKDATATVISKFATVIKLCDDPVLSKKLADAMSKYVEGNHEMAETDVEAVLAEVLLSEIPGYDE